MASRVLDTTNNTVGNLGFEQQPNANANQTKAVKLVACAALVGVAIFFGYKMGPSIWNRGVEAVFGAGSLVRSTLLTLAEKSAALSSVSLFR